MAYWSAVWVTHYHTLLLFNVFFLWNFDFMVAMAGSDPDPMSTAWRWRSGDLVTVPTETMLDSCLQVDAGMCIHNFVYLWLHHFIHAYIYNHITYIYIYIHMIIYVCIYVYNRCMCIIPTLWIGLRKTVGCGNKWCFEVFCPFNHTT